MGAGKRWATGAHLCPLARGRNCTSNIVQEAGSKFPECGLGTVMGKGGWLHSQINQTPNG